MNAEIISVGTELLLGDILNTNAQYISKQLALLGIGIYFQTVVGDNPERLLNAYKNAFERAGIVITTGGLGPTDDDLTKETAAEYFSKKMIQDEYSLKHLKKYFKDMDNMPKSNLKQSYIPEGAKPIPNPNGTAPGCMIEENGKILIMLPGPPRETIPIFEQSIIPYLKEKQDFTIISKTLHLCGIGESAAAEAVNDLINKSENPTVAPYAKTNEMFFRITARASNKQDAERLIKPVVDEIYKRLGCYIYGEDDTTLAEAVIREVINKNMTVAAAESCTGGMLSSEIISFPGASKAYVDGCVTYSNESKIKRLGVSAETLEKYGAVSTQTAVEMAVGAKKMLNTDIGLATTGVAGPDGGTAEKPVGLVYIAVSIKDKIKCRELRLNGSREKIRSRTVTEILDLLRCELKNI